MFLDSTLRVVVSLTRSVPVLDSPVARKNFRSVPVSLCCQTEYGSSHCFVPAGDVPQCVGRFRKQLLRCVC